MNQSTIVLRNDVEPRVETIALDEFEKQLSDKSVYRITDRASGSTLDLPEDIKNTLFKHNPLLRQGFKYFGSGKTFRHLLEEDPAFYRDILPVLHFAFQYGAYDLGDYGPRLPKILVREIKYDTKNLPTFNINRRYINIERKPNGVEFALGIFLEEADPLIRDLVSSLAKKGYGPVCSCQGHPGFGNKGGVGCEVILPEDIVMFIQSGGASIGHGRYTDIDIEHETMPPLEFLAVTQKLARELPKIDELKLCGSKSATEFREFYK